MPESPPGPEARHEHVRRLRREVGRLAARVTALGTAHALQQREFFRRAARPGGSPRRPGGTSGPDPDAAAEAEGRRWEAAALHAAGAELRTEFDRLHERHRGGAADLLAHRRLVDRRRCTGRTSAGSGWTSPARSSGAAADPG
jgi:hypothetical protein